MANDDRLSWQKRLLNLTKDVNTFIRRWISWSAILALLVASLWYSNLINVASDIKNNEIRRQEKQKGNPSDSTILSNNPGSRTNNSLPVIPIDELNDLKFDYSNEDVYNNFRESRPLERLLTFLRRPYTWIVCGLSIAILLIFILTYKRRVFLEKKTKENDSATFVKLLKDFENDIGSLGTPRRVKRQINKLRFQYNLLENEKKIPFENDSQKFLFEISLKAELDHTIFDSFENLQKAQKASKYPEISQAYLRRIYELNENVYAGDGVDKN